MDTEILDQRVHVVLAFFSPWGRQELLRILELPDDERTQQVGLLYQSGANPGLADLLMDLEGHPRFRKRVAEELKAILGQVG